MDFLSQMGRAWPQALEEVPEDNYVFLTSLVQEIMLQTISKCTQNRYSVLELTLVDHVADNIIHVTKLEQLLDSPQHAESQSHATGETVKNQQDLPVDNPSLQNLDSFSAGDYDDQKAHTSSMEDISKLKWDNISDSDWGSVCDVEQEVDDKHQKTLDIEGMGPPVRDIEVIVLPVSDTEAVVHPGNDTEGKVPPVSDAERLIYSVSETQPVKQHEESYNYDMSQSKGISRGNVQHVKYHCFLCTDSAFYEADDLRDHLKSTHFEVEKKFAYISCIMCAARFRAPKKMGNISVTIQKLISHLYNTHEFVGKCFANFKQCSELLKKVCKAAGREPHVKQTDIDLLHKPSKPVIMNNSTDMSSHVLSSTSPHGKDHKQQPPSHPHAADEVCESLVCFLCDMSLSSDLSSKWKVIRQHVLDSHVVHEENSTYIKCRLCERTFGHLPNAREYVDISTLLRNCLSHCQKVHKYPDQIPPYFDTHICTQCNEAFLLRRDYTRHLKKHNPMQPMTQCDKCGKLITKAHQTAHLSFCPGVKNKDLKKCQECAKAFPTKHSLKKHVEVVHLKTKDHLCSICAKAFSKRYSLHLHMLRIHNINETGKPVETCSVCQYQTFSGPEMAMHVRDRHKTGEFPCKICDMVFIEKKKLHYHMYKIHTDKSVYQCDKCAYYTNCQRRLTQHTAVKHHGQKLICDICKYKGLTEQQLLEHMQEKHPQPEETDPRPYKCENCSLQFATKNRQITHMFSKHGVNVTGRQVLQCPLCSFQSIEMAMYRRHVTTKHEKGEFSCNKCSKTFNCATKLKFHLQRLHPGSEHHKCPHCSYISELKSHVKLHIARKHGGKRHKCPHCKYYTFYDHLYAKHLGKVHNILASDPVSSQPSSMVDELLPLSQPLNILPLQQSTTVSYLPRQDPKLNMDLNLIPSTSTINIIPSTGPSSSYPTSTTADLNCNLNQLALAAHEMMMVQNPGYSQNLESEAAAGGTISSNVTVPPPNVVYYGSQLSQVLSYTNQSLHFNNNMQPPY